MVQGNRWLLSVTAERIVVMKKSDVTYLAGCIFTAMTAFFYCCTMWFSINLPRYYPLEHTWKFIEQQNLPSQDWYGMQAFAFLAAGAVTIIVYLILKYSLRENVNLKPTLQKLIGIITTMIIVVCMGYMLWYEFGRWGIFK